MKTAPNAATATGPARNPLALRTRRRWWAALLTTLLLCLALTPRPWQTLLHHALTWEAARHGFDLGIDHLEGGPFDTMCLYGVRARQRGSSLAQPTGTDVRIARLELTPDWSLTRRDARHSWLRQLTAVGVTGRYDLTPLSPAKGQRGATKPRSWIGKNLYRFIPLNFYVEAETFQVRRGRYHLGTQGLRLSGNREAVGLLLARELEIGGPDFQNTFLNRHGTTSWHGDRLTVNGVELAPGVRLATAMLDGTHLGRRRLEGAGTLTVLGGEVRAQGAMNLSRTRLDLEAAGTLRQLPVQSLARLLGLIGSAGGEIEQGNFSFHGDPGDWANAETWLAARATDFRWGRRRWQSLELQAMVVHQRVQVNRLELQQNRNQLSLRGELPLPASWTGGKPVPGGGHWWDAGFSCVVDARLDDLRALSMLLGPGAPATEGRMSVNGTLDALPGRPGINGYLNVEGSRLTISGVPLDSLRSTLIFRGEEMEVADLQATRGGDYLAGKWTTRLAGASGYEGWLKVAVKDRSFYTPALGNWVDLNQIGLGSEESNGPLNLDGTFKGPGPHNEIVFQNNGSAADPLRVPVPTVGDWWRDD